MSTGARLGILAGIVAVAIVVLVIASGGSDDDSSSTTAAAPATTTGADRTTTTKTTTATKPAGPPVYRVVVKDAKPVGGIKKIKVNKGDKFVFVVKSDTADEIHIHGYDVHKDVDAGGTVRFNLDATIDGEFEIELEERKEQIAELTVEP